MQTLINKNFQLTKIWMKLTKKFQKEINKQFNYSKLIIKLIKLIIIYRNNTILHIK